MYKEGSLACRDDVLEILPFLLIGAAVLAVAVAFLWPAPWEFPMDDAYIHLSTREIWLSRGN
jgi:hypothetical protein